MKHSLTDVYRSLHAFLTRLFAGRAPRTGLEISDQALRILFERKGQWQLEQVALPPGTMAKGKVINAVAVAQALAEIRRRVGGDAKRRRIGVHVTLASAPVYTQQVAIPNVSSAELPSAVELNVQVSAPVALSELAWGWQPLPGQNPPAILAAWTDRALVDQLVALLAQANFLPASLEPKVLSLARLIRELYPNGATGAFVLVSVDEAGVAFSVVDAGTVRFQYEHGWDEVRGGNAGEVTYAMLESLIRREIPQVAGFYAQRGGVLLTEALVATPLFPEEIAQTLGQLGFSAHPLQLGGSGLPLPGYGAFGAALRGGIFAVTDQKDLSLLGGQVLAWLRKELVVRIAGFWSIVAPVALALLLVTYGAAYLFASRIRASITASAPQVAPALLAELADRESQAKRFNDTVRALTAIQAKQQLRSPLMSRIFAKASEAGVSLTRVTLGTSGGTVAGNAGGDSQLLSFKRALEGDQELSGVSLPIAELRSGPDGIAFTMSFSINASAAGNETP